MSNKITALFILLALGTTFAAMYIDQSTAEESGPETPEEKEAREAEASQMEGMQNMSGMGGGGMGGGMGGGGGQGAGGGGGGRPAGGGGGAAFGGGGGGGQGGQGGQQRDPDAIIESLFTRADANEDGKLTGDEISERLAERLDSVDSDGNGEVSKEEYTKSLKAMFERRSEQGGGGGGGSPGGAQPNLPDPGPEAESE